MIHCVLFSTFIESHMNLVLKKKKRTTYGFRNTLEFLEISVPLS